jgi:hypothetical protein
MLVNVGKAALKLFFVRRENHLKPTLNRLLDCLIKENFLIFRQLTDAREQ